MYLLKVNKNIVKKTFKGLFHKYKKDKFKLVSKILIFLIILNSLSFGKLGTNLFSYGEQSLKYGNFPILRGNVNSKEFKDKYYISDAKDDLNKCILLNILDIIKPENTKIYPKKILTRKEAVNAMVKILNNDNSEKALNDKQLEGKGIELGFFTKNEIDEFEKNNNFKEKFIDSNIKISELNSYFSKTLKLNLTYKQNPNSYATRLDLASMVYENKEKIFLDRDVELVQGKIIKKGTIVENGVNKKLISVKLDKNYLIKKDDSKDEFEDKSSRLMYENKEDSTLTNYIDILSENNIPIIFKSFVDLDDKYAWEESQLTMYVKGNKILFMENFPLQTNVVTGAFESIVKKNLDLDRENNDEKEAVNDLEVITIKDFNNVTHIYKLSPNVVINEVQGEIGSLAREIPIKRDNLIFGQDLELEIRNNYVQSIKAYTSVEEELDGYVHPESQMISGKVLGINENSITLSDRKVYKIFPETVIMKDGEMKEFKDIKDGDNVKLFFDDIYDVLVSKIEVEGKQRQSDKILKGKIGSYLLSKKSLNLKNIQKFENNYWVNSDEKAFQNIKVQGKIYGDSNEIKSSKLKNYKNQDIYVILNKNQGIPTIAKGKVRLGKSLVFKDNIKNIDYTQNTFSINDNIVTFNDSTIVIKDGNIVSVLNIENNVNSYVETDRLKKAQLIIQDDIDFAQENITKYPYKIYRGTLRDVFEDSILLGNDIEKGRKVNHFFMWQGGNWKRFSEGKTTPRLKYTQETKIYDYDNDKYITIEELKEAAKKINVYGARPDYFNRQVYAVTKDDLLVGISLVKAEGYVEVNSQNTIVAKSLGEYKDSENKNEGNNKTESKINKILVTNIREYNGNLNRLEPVKPITIQDPSTQSIKQKSVKKIINIDKAIVIKDGEVIPKTSIDSLKDANLTIVFRQTRDKKKENNVEVLDAILVQNK